MLRALLALAFALTAAAAQAQAPADNLADGRSGKIHFKSVTPTGGFNLVRGGTIPEAVVFGTLMLPQGTASLPAVVVAHGSGGVRYEREFTWARRLVAQGYAAFVVDSFTPRRISQTATDQSRLPTAANVADALAALKLLATHPRIDPARIAVIGFSKGGQVALYTSLEPYRAAVIKDPKLKFAAHIALYPYCNDWQISEHLTGAPVLMLLGGRDDYTPAKPCIEYSGWLRGKGAPIETVIYPRGGHQFDSSRTPRYLANMVTGRNCHSIVDFDNFRVTLRPSGEDITPRARNYFATCSTRGATIGGDPEARVKAPADVAAFLKKAFGN